MAGLICHDKEAGLCPMGDAAAVGRVRNRSQIFILERLLGGSVRLEVTAAKEKKIKQVV